MSRPVARNSANQFDDVPSPRARSHNKSRHSNISAGRSRLSQRVMGNDDDLISATTHGTNGFADMSLDIEFPDDLSLSHRSFTELDRDAMEDDEMDGVVDELPTPSPKRKKGNPPSSDDPPAQSPKRKRGQVIERTTSPEEPPPGTQTPDAEEEIQHQLEDLTNGDEHIGEQEEVQEDEEEEAVALKKSRMDKGKEKEKEKGQARKKEAHREGMSFALMIWTHYFIYPQVCAEVNEGPSDHLSGGETRNMYMNGLRMAPSLYLTLKKSFEYRRNRRSL